MIDKNIIDMDGLLYKELKSMRQDLYFLAQKNKKLNDTYTDKCKHSEIITNSYNLVAKENYQLRKKLEDYKRDIKLSKWVIAALMLCFIVGPYLLDKLVNYYL